MVTSPHTMYNCCYVGVAGLHCSRNWDGWLCWDDTAAGIYTSQNCPNYFVDFDPTGEQHDSRVSLF
uniref:G-protein coupled receptors family 2 profile 1 domain-containing protein n=1 Tax=Cyclopterus lumpus TaxID=8103 RepID=A0A8C2ZKH4_CYCLU